MKKVCESGLLMLIGAVILTGGIFFGTRIIHSGDLNAGTVTSEDLLSLKSEIISNIIEVQGGTNKYIASRKASELSNLDIEKLKELKDLGVSIIIVSSEDVYDTIDKTKAEVNEQNGIITDSVYLSTDNELFISTSAPNGVLTQQVSNIINE